MSTPFSAARGRIQTSLKGFLLPVNYSKGLCIATKNCLKDCYEVEKIMLQLFRFKEYFFVFY